MLLCVHSREEFKENTGGGSPRFSSKLAKLEFPGYSGDVPTEWFNRVDQFFEYQDTPVAQKVSLASFTTKVKLINGGNGYAEPTKKKGENYHGQCSRKNSGLVLDLLSVKILMRPYQG